MRGLQIIRNHKSVGGTRLVIFYNADKTRVL